EAEQTLDAVLEYAPRYAPALKLRGQLAMQFQQWAQAEDLLRKSIAEEPFDHQANYLLYQCLNSAGKTEDAKKQHVRFLELEADLHRLNTLLTVEVARRPHDADTAYEVGVLMLRFGQTQKGIEWLYRALNHDPRHSRSHAVLAEQFQRTGDTQRAAVHRRQVQPGTVVPSLRLSDLPATDGK